LGRRKGRGPYGEELHSSNSVVLLLRGEDVKEVTTGTGGGLDRSLSYLPLQISVGPSLFSLLSRERGALSRADARGLAPCGWSVTERKSDFYRKIILDKEGEERENVGGLPR